MNQSKASEAIQRAIVFLAFLAGLASVGLMSQAYAGPLPAKATKAPKRAEQAAFDAAMLKADKRDARIEFCNEQRSDTDEDGVSSDFEDCMSLGGAK